MNAYNEQLQPRHGYIDREWKAHLHLNFRCRENRSFLAETSHRGPYVIQRPFYPEGGLCHGYLLHPPGGMVSGDHLHLAVHNHHSAQSLITTPSAGKFYHQDTEQHRQRQSIAIQVDDNASLEFLPMENIFFTGCHATLQTEINLHPGASFIGWETLCFGRPHSDEPFHTGEINVNTLVRIGGDPIFRDQLWIPGDPEFLQAPWGLRGFQTLSTFIATHLSLESFEPLQRQLHQNNYQDYQFSATQIGPLSIFRLFARNSEIAQHQLRELWRQLRPNLLDRPVVTPRIWNT